VAAPGSSVCLERSATVRADREREQQAADLEQRRAVLEEKAVSACNRGQQRRQVALALAALRRQVETAQAAELARALEQLGHVDERDREVVRQFGQRMVDQMVLQLGRRMQQVLAQEPTDAEQALLIQLLAGAEALPDEADRETLAKATPGPRPSTRRALQRKPR
jgi:glutamyl-tRNA reductase